MTHTLTLARHEFLILKSMVDDRLDSLKATIEKNSDVIID